MSLEKMPKLKSSTDKEWAEYHRMRARELDLKISALTQTLASERDRFGKRETELMRENAALKSELEDTKVTLRSGALCHGLDVDAKVSAEKEIVRLRDALKRIFNMHGANECGMCGSYDAAREALSPAATKEKERGEGA